MTLNKKHKFVIVDFGIFFNVAQKISERFETFYFSPWTSDFPTSSETEIGEGFESVEKIKYFWKFVDNILDSDKDDFTFIFPDIYMSDIQLHLLKLGFNVWGSRDSDSMEIYRIDFLKFQEKIGMDVPPYVIVEGIEALKKEVLKSSEKKIIKINADERGDAETYTCCHPDLTEMKINEWSYKLGFKGKIKKFIVQDMIEGNTEIGYDGFCIDGEFPSRALFGREKKGVGYVGEVRNYDDLPEGIKEVNKKLSPALKKYGIRGSFSSEIIEGIDGKHYMIDPCMRMPSPPTELIIEIWGNMPECMHAGSRGVILIPEYKSKYGAELIFHSDAANKNYYTTIYPDSIKQWVKQRKITFMDGNSRVIPQHYGNTNVGSVIAIGDDIDQTVQLCKDRADMIMGDSIECEPHCLDDAIEELKKLQP